MSRFQDLSARQKTLTAAGVLILLIVLLGIIAEAAVRVRHYLKFGGMWGIEDTYTVDAEAGLRIPIPSSEVGAIRINALGFRSPELATPKPAGTLRLAFLGASTTYNPEVSSNEATWSYLVVQRLKQQWPEAKFDYINGGVPGYGATTSLKNLRRRVAQHEPDVIVIYHATNDMSGNSFDLALQRGIVAQRTEQQLTWPSRYSLLWYLVEKNLRVIDAQSDAKSSAGKLEVEPDLLLGPFEEDLKTLCRASAEVASFVALATFSHHLREGQSEKQQNDAAVTNLFYMPYLSIDSILEGYTIYNDTIRRVAAGLELHLIDGEFDIPGDSVHFVDSVHFTDAGSKAMAQRVADSLIASQSFEQLVRTRSDIQ